MKKLFIIGLFVFWGVSVSLFAAALVIKETGTTTGVAGNGNSRSGSLNGLDNNNLSNLGDLSSTTDPLLADVATDGTDSVSQDGTGGAVSEGVTEGQAYTTETRIVEKTQYLDKSLVAKHNTKNDCWLIIEGAVYDVGEYIPFHPGGEYEIIPYCGQDSSVGFATKGRKNSPHSAAANAILKKYFIGNLGDSWGKVKVTEQVRVPVGGNIADGVVVPAASTPAAVQTPATTPVTSTGGKFSIGTAVKASSNVKVRQSASATGGLVGVESTGATGRITKGPTYADGYYWYYVEYGDGMKGWSAQDFLSVTSAVVTTPTTQPDTTPVETPTVPGTQTCTSFTYNSWGSCQSNGTESRTVKTSSPSSCTGGAPVVTRSCTYVAPETPVTPVTGGLTASSVATHNSVNSCWIIVSNKVYDVTQYIPFHPGGQNQITPYCGKDATSAFQNRGGTGSHSTNAHNLLANYLVGDLQGTTPVTPDPGTQQCTSFSYSSWGSCQSNGIQTRSTTGSSPSGCTGGSPVTSQSCTYVPPVGVDTTAPTVAIVNPSSGSLVSGTITIDATASDAVGVSSVQFLIDSQSIKTDTSSPYSASLNTSSYSDGSHTINAIAIDAAGNTKSTSITLSFNNAPVTPPPSSGGVTAATVATHNSSGNCWLIISGKVYDVTQYIPFHPGGQSRIINNCGTDATTLFTSNAGQGHNHSSSAKSLLAGYYVGDLQTAATCSSFNYSAWGSCQSNSTQSRTVTSSSPSGCTGGSPVTTQSCTYTPPEGTPICTSFNYSAWGSCQSNSTQSRTVTGSSPSGCAGGTPVTSQSCTYTPPAVAQTYTINVSSSGALSPSSLTINAGDSINFVGVGLGDEVKINFSPSTISSIKLDHERTTALRTFSSAGTWTFGQGGSVTVQ